MQKTMRVILPSALRLRDLKVNAEMYTTIKVISMLPLPFEILVLNLSICVGRFPAVFVIGIHQFDLKY